MYESFIEGGQPGNSSNTDVRSPDADLVGGKPYEPISTRAPQPSQSPQSPQPSKPVAHVSWLGLGIIALAVWVLFLGGWGVLTRTGATTQTGATRVVATVRAIRDPIPPTVQALPAGVPPVQPGVVVTTQPGVPGAVSPAIDAVQQATADDAAASSGHTVPTVATLDGQGTGVNVHAQGDGHTGPEPLIMGPIPNEPALEVQPSSIPDAASSSSLPACVYHTKSQRYDAAPCNHWISIVNVDD